MKSYEKDELNFTLDHIDGLEEGVFKFRSENNDFIKLGDGTFGVVFAVSKVEETFCDDSYAIKLLYEPDDDETASKIQFEKEMTASRDIQRELKKKKDQSSATEEKRADSHKAEAAKSYVGVISSIGGTRNFHQSSVYQNNKEYFDSLRISNYALVLPLYETTLKQLLEGEVKDPANNSSIKQISYTGYDALRRMGFKDRIRNSLPYLRQIAEGLRTLHKAGYCHLDIKPANIYIRQYADDIEAVIGDLGFISLNDQAQISPTLVPGNRGNKPLGTRHYRSPEQKDYFDIADAELIVEDKENPSLELVVRDLKFRDTIIDDRDVVFFSKYKVQREIKEIKIDHLNEEIPTKVTLWPMKGQGKLDGELKPDRKTQVIFYKRQEYRTDLFGFGAIVYDLLTCGKSPELFYEMIRSYDSPNESVKQIIDQYIQVSRFRSVEPGLLKLFEPFRLHRNSTIYAPHEVVELILKCMLYRAKGTFYHSFCHNNSSGNYVMEEVIRELKSLSRDYIPINEISENYLYLKQLPKQSSSQDITFQESLEALQDLDIEKFPKRLSDGIVYLLNLVRFLSDLYQCQNTNDTHSDRFKFFFSELQPQNLFIPNTTNNQVTINHILYESRETYEQDLEKDLAYTKISGNPGNAFTPPFFTFMRREIYLKPHNAYNLNGDSRDLDAKEEKDEFSYSFYDSSFYSDQLDAGDWLVFKPYDLSRNALIEVENVNSGDNVVKINFPKDAQIQNEFNKIMKEQGRVHLIFYKNLNPCSYYLYMVGIYIYNIFFSGLKGNDFNRLLLNLLTGIGSSGEIAEMYLHSSDSLLSRVIRVARNRYRSGKAYESLKDIIGSLLLIYLKLVFPNCKASYRSEVLRMYQLNQDILTSQIDVSQLNEISKVENSVEYAQQIFAIVEKEVQVLSEHIVKFVSFNSEMNFNENLLGTALFNDFLETVSLSDLIGGNKSRLNLRFDDLVVERLKFRASEKGRFLSKIRIERNSLF